MPLLDVNENGRAHTIHFLQLPAQQADAQIDFVCIHGLAANLAFWYAGIAPQLTRFGRVCLYDLRGHGGSGLPDSGHDVATQCADLASLLDHVGVRQCHLIAHSFGGSIALAFAVRYPQRVLSLVLADVRIPLLQPTLRISELPSVPNWRTTLRKLHVDFDDGHQESGLLLLTALARLQIERPADAETLRHAYMGQNARFGPRAARRWLQLAENTQALAEFTAHPPYVEDDLARLRMPILVLVGEHSVTRPSASRFAALCPRAHLEILPRAGHFFPLSRRRQFLHALARFYGGIMTTTTAPRARPARRAGATR